MGAELDLMAIDGRRLGQRAQQTRRRLLDATAELLEDKGILDLKVVDVARRIDSSPATFYQYFANVDEAVLVLAGEVGQAFQMLAAKLEGSWEGAAGLERVRSFVDAFVTFWETHRGVLRTRNLAAQEGDERFRRARLDALERITDLVSERVGVFQAAGAVPQEISAYATAGALVAMVERMAAFQGEFEARGVTRTAMVATVARMIHHSVTGGWV